jgi:hypothetical protein
MVTGLAARKGRFAIAVKRVEEIALIAASFPKAWPSGSAWKGKFHLAHQSSIPFNVKNMNEGVKSK